MSETQGLVEIYAAVRPSLFAVLPAAIVALFAMIVLLADLFELGTTRDPEPGTDGRAITAPWLAVIGTALGTVAVVWQALRLDEAGGSYFNGMVALDGFGVFLSGVILVGTLLTLLITIGYARRTGIHLAELYHLILMTAVGMVLMAQATNLVMVFLALELLSVGAYVLTGFRRTRLSSVEGALKYFVMGAFSTGFFVYGMALVYGATGTMDLAGIGEAVAAAGVSPLLVSGLGLLVVGFGFKVALVPFHMWSPDVYQGAPSPITGFMATGVKAAAFAAFVRVMAVSFGGAIEQWVPIVWILAVLTMVVGNVAAIRQDDIKRMLAYSSIAHAGYLAVALVAHSALGTAAFLYYMAAYTLMTLGAFGVVVALGERSGDNASISRDWAGLGWREPFLGVAMTVFLLSLTGVPPTAGFVGKFQILSAAVEAGFVPLAVILVLASVVSAYYYLKVVVAMYMTSPGGEPVPARIGPAAGVALVAATAGVLGLGVFPGEWIDLARAAVDGFVAVAAR